MEAGRRALTLRSEACFRGLLEVSRPPGPEGIVKSRHVHLLRPSIYKGKGKAPFVLSLKEGCWTSEGKIV